jgi:multidrug efflux system membrane fusion protein
VSTAVVRKGDIGIYVNALGMVTPVYTVQVKSRVDGQLVAVNYVEGQTVHAGDSLVEIRWGEGRGEGQLDLQRCMVNGWL